MVAASSNSMRPDWGNTLGRHGMRLLARRVKPGH